MYKDFTPLITAKEVGAGTVIDLKEYGYPTIVVFVFSDARTAYGVELKQNFSTQPGDATIIPPDSLTITGPNIQYNGNMRYVQSDTDCLMVFAYMGGRMPQTAGPNVLKVEIKSPTTASIEFDKPVNLTTENPDVGSFFVSGGTAEGKLPTITNAVLSSNRLDVNLTLTSTVPIAAGDTFDFKLKSRVVESHGLDAYSDLETVVNSI